jgi:sugar phosphate isomerase/epimerase
MNRRDFVRHAIVTMGGAAALGGCASCVKKETGTKDAKKGAEPLYEISLAQWSLHRALFAGEVTALDFPRVARTDYDVGAVEYVNSFFKDQATDTGFLDEMAGIAADHDVTSLLIMVDGEGALGDPDDAARRTAVENHHRWVAAARHLGCHSIRVNAQSSGSADEQQRFAADGLRTLTEFADTHDINVIVENHGGLSSNGAWLASVIERVDHPRCGTLPDFGNFRIAEGEWYDRYDGVTELMPFAKAVSAKSHEFDADGNEVHTDYRRMMRIVLDAGYRGYVGIEYEGSKHTEPEGIRATKALLERVRAELTPAYSA